MRKTVRYVSTQQGTILKLFLAFVMILFIGILVATYFVAEKANPVLLDEHGAPINSTRK